MWLIAAVLSSVFAGLTAILSKCGVKKTDSDVATALRTVVVLLFSWLVVFISGSYRSLPDVSAVSLLFLVLSGLSTGASWLFYFKALSSGDVNKVAPIDKSSVVLSVLLAIVCFRETDRLAAKLCGVALLAVGVFLMTEKKRTDSEKTEKRSWIVYAALSAVFASLSSLLAKAGIENVASDLGTAVRTCVVLVMAWLVVFAKGKQSQIKKTDGRELLFICLSGLATGASWLFYYYAVQKGVLSVVIPIDKTSILFTVLFSYFALGEKLTKKAFIGLLLMLAGTLAMAIWI